MMADMSRVKSGKVLQPLLTTDETLNFRERSDLSWIHFVMPSTFMSGFIAAFSGRCHF